MNRRQRLQLQLEILLEDGIGKHLGRLCGYTLLAWLLLLTVRAGLQAPTLDSRFEVALKGAIDGIGELFQAVGEAGPADQLSKAKEKAIEVLSPSATPTPNPLDVEESELRKKKDEDVKRQLEMIRTIVKGTSAEERTEEKR